MNYTIDWNEWVEYISSFVALCFFFMIRTYFQTVVKIMIWIFTLAYVETIDYFLAASPFKVYYCGDNMTYEPSTGVIHFFFYPPFSFIFLYFYDKWKIRGIRLICYMLLWDGLSVLIEWIYLENGIFNYTGWKLYYSVPIYPISNLILIKLYHFILKHLQKREVITIENKVV